MMLDNTKKEVSNSALATLSLIRSIGTAIAPAIMIGFLAHAGTAVQTNVMALLPKEAVMPNLPYAQELNQTMNKLKTDAMTKEKFKDINIPDLTAFKTVKINMNGNNGKVPDNLLELMKSSDVTTIVKSVKEFTNYMFEQMTPKIIESAQNGIQSGIDGVGKGLNDLDMAVSRMQAGPKNPGMVGALQSMKTSQSQMKDTQNKMAILKDAIPGSFEKAKSDYLSEIDKSKGKIEGEFQKTLNGGFKQVYLTVAISSFIALAILSFYKRKRLEME
jgi:hypothetical protein